MTRCSDRMRGSGTRTLRSSPLRWVGVSGGGGGGVGGGCAGGSC